MKDKQPAGQSNRVLRRASRSRQQAQPTPRPPRHGVRAELEKLREEGAFWLWLKERIRETPGWMTSAVVHAVVLAVLMLIAIAPDVRVSDLSLTVLPSETPEVIDQLPPVDPPEIPVEVDAPIIEPLQDPTEPQPMDALLQPIDSTDSPPPVIEPLASENFAARPEDLIQGVGTNQEKGIGHRTSGELRRQMLFARGGDEQTEAAVALALKWIVAHQNRDGSWSFNHGLAPRHQGAVNFPGKNPSRTGATAMALLPLLGAGQTHKDGEYKESVYRGLHFLVRSMKYDPRTGGNLMGDGGRMYAHGLAAIALCEAYALTRDKSLMQPAQQSLNFIVYAQDKTGGGWRYSPHDPGDTSAVGWQLMALKSGHLAYLQVPRQTVAGAINFLNSVQEGYGAYYGYMKPGRKPSTTAVGLLCRMYLGWKKGEAALIEGVKFLDKQGPSKSDMYYNYYATQVMNHWEGEEWERWNAVMKKQLVDSQVTGGSFFGDKGSWTPTGKNHKTENGGRLYYTSLCTMTLEVYYRHMPLYDRQGVEDDF